jgi:hypothetical protein
MLNKQWGTAIYPLSSACFRQWFKTSKEYNIFIFSRKGTEVFQSFGGGYVELMEKKLVEDRGGNVYILERKKNK